MLCLAYYFSCSAPGTLRMAEPLNCGLSMPPGQLRRMGMLRHSVAADSPAAAVKGRVGCGLIVDRRDTKRPAVS